jgi:putative membrane protein
MTWWHMGWGPWNWLWMTLLIALLVVLTVAAVVLVLRWAQPGSREPDPERLLAARFAKGEIDADEYAGRLERLRAEAEREGTRRPNAIGN